MKVKLVKLCSEVSAPNRANTTHIHAPAGPGSEKEHSCCGSVHHGAKAGSVHVAYGVHTHPTQGGPLSPVNQPISEVRSLGFFLETRIWVVICGGDFMCQHGWAMVPRYVLKHYSECFSEDGFR